jgi:hypothetical protein
LVAITTLVYVRPSDSVELAVVTFSSVFMFGYVPFAAEAGIYSGTADAVEFVDGGGRRGGIAD